ncbi:hypothetical protein [Sphingobium sp. ZW T5_29]|jgi:hypothetical protein|uniref:hypothetical protein n=1 Tax=Sphingobium sp. ZW T5_29 TaxID=3378077 RepID=UPI0038551F00
MSAATEPKSVLTRDEVREAMLQIKFKPGSEVSKAAEHFARLCRSDADDMLNEAVKRALSSRQCPTGIDVEQFLNGILRSISSSRSIARTAAKNEVYVPIPELLAAVGLTSMTSPPPDEILEIERQRAVYAEVIEELARQSSAIAILIDAIDQGLRGKDIEDLLSISTHELAALRKTLKRRAEKAKAEVRLDPQ